MSELMRHNLIDYFSNVRVAFKTRDLCRIAHTLIKTANIRRETDIEMQIKRKSEA